MINSFSLNVVTAPVIFPAQPSHWVSAKYSSICHLCHQSLDDVNLTLCFTCNLQALFHVYGKMMMDITKASLWLFTTPTPVEAWSSNVCRYSGYRDRFVGYITWVRSQSPRDRVHYCKKKQVYSQPTPWLFHTLPLAHPLFIHACSSMGSSSETTWPWIS